MAGYDAIVIGVGGMGSAALYHLARRGLKVLGIEQFDVAHDRGSSHGQSRIIRRAYFEHPDYVPLLDRVYPMWRELEADTGRDLFVRTGLMLAGPAEGAIISGVRRAGAAHELRIDDVPAPEVARRFGAFAVPESMDVLFEQDAGYLRVEACIEAHVDRAVACGAELVLGQAVRGWCVEGAGVAVTTDRQRFLADRLVLCAGAWTGQLAAELGWPLEVRRKVVLWFQDQAAGFRVSRGCPVFGFDTPEGFFYGFPAGDDGRVKTGNHSGGLVTDDASLVDRALHPADVEPVQRFVERHLPGLGGQVLDHSVCLYTVTPDEHFIVDRHRDHARVLLAAGFSGHGFKFAPVVGSVLADLAVAGRTDEPAALWSARRNAIRST
ncbi:MAG: N-methyl-L-tryptophan oxidase [Phycisphaerae bacterium]